MLCRIQYSDFEELSALIAATISKVVTRDDREATSLVDEVVASLQNWLVGGSPGFHAKCRIDDAIAGFVIVKDFWNLSHLFVLPIHQGKGIGRQLVGEALMACREASPRRKIQLNSSTLAAGFYTKLGFKQIGPERDRPGGCIPFEYDF